MNLSEKNKKRIKIVIACVVLVLLVFFLVVSPYMKFKRNEKQMINAAKRYYEINTRSLPTGEKTKTISLQTLYEKDFISRDLRSPYMGKVCDSKESWVKVKKEEGEYQYYVYLKCGMFRSNVDHEGPHIKLKGKEEITLHKGEEYKELGVESVSDKTDGKLDVKEVEIDHKKVNVDQVGDYEVIYKIKDSLGNETRKVRVVHVIETLNHVVEKDTKKKNVYQGDQNNNYVKLDGILFKIVGINEDKTVKLVTNDNIASINYEGIDSWLNEYFYEKLSNSAKKLMVKSKFCEEEVKNPESYTKCSQYGKKKNVGLLSVLDINRSKDSEENYNVNSAHNTLLQNKQGSKQLAFSSGEYKGYHVSENIGVRPVVNIKEETDVVFGDGTFENPYILKGNKSVLKAGSKISDARVGEYLTYSGYTFRVIGKESDGTTKVIMDGNLKDSIYPFHDNLEPASYDISNHENIAYKISNELSKNISSKYFAKKTINRNIYQKNVSYQEKPTNDKIDVKLSLPSIYDLFSATNPSDFWFINYSKKNHENYQYLQVLGVVHKSKDTVSEAGVRLVGYLDASVKVKKGNGTLDHHYSIVK